MLRSDFHYKLPPELIAQQPPKNRGDSRLLVVQNGSIIDEQFNYITNLLTPKDLLVFNDTRVIPARLFAKKESGGSVEIVIERITSDYQAMAHLRASRSPKVGSKIFIHTHSKDDDIIIEITNKDGSLFSLKFSKSKRVIDILNEYGKIPLPPYIKRDEPSSQHSVDKKRYQTIYAKHSGAVAAPTAGLHFTQGLLDQIEELGVKSAFVTLHVGAGTFQPMRCENIYEHTMHKEQVDLSTETCEMINETKRSGGRVIAVGTTTVRTLESASNENRITPFSGETDIFIYPGYKFNIVDAMITNFHLPESTLLMLVSAFTSKELIISAYQHAIKEQYRFFSYGDAMWLEP